MPVYDPNFTADKAAERLPVLDAVIASGRSHDALGGEVFDIKRTDYTRKGRKERVAPPELTLMQQYKQQRVRIFNVGPWRHEVPCGSAGTFIIPACPLGTAYVEMSTPLHAVEDELVIVSEKEYKRLQDEGRYIANEILGRGRGRDRKGSLDHLGVFIAEGQVPTEKELEDARANLHVKCQEYINEMRTYWDIDRKTAHTMYKPAIHGMAAKILGLHEEEWMLSKTPKAPEKVTTVKCEGCRTEVEADAPMCFKCGGVVNPDTYVEYMAKQENIKTATAPKKKAN